MNDKSETQKPVETSFFVMPDDKHLLTIDKYGLIHSVAVAEPVTWPRNLSGFPGILRLQ